MTTNKQRAISDAAVREAGLLATFYLPRDKKRVQALQYRFCQSLDLAQEGPGGYSDLAEEAFLIRFEPSDSSPIAHDTSIIQLALNAPDGDDSPWETTREKLEKSIRDIAEVRHKSIRDAANLDDKRIWSAAGLDNILGYTLTYQALLNPRLDKDRAFEELRPTVRRLYWSGNLYALAQAEVAGGRMWLLHTADRGDGPAAATVYVALSTSEDGNAFNKVFSGVGASLLKPDLIAHKGYHQKRQYSGTNQQKYEKDLGNLQRTTRGLLTHLKEPASVAPDELLGKLSRDYGELIEMVWDLDNVRIAMAQQSYNFVQQLNDLGPSPAAINSNNILHYHHDRIKAASAELELMVTEGRHALEAANPVLRMAQLRTDKAQERRQLRIEALLAAVGIALALPHLLDPETTAALLWWFGIDLPHTENGLLTESGHLIVFKAQFLIVLTFAVAAYLVVKVLLRKPGGILKRGRS